MPLSPEDIAVLVKDQGSRLEQIQNVKAEVEAIPLTKRTTDFLEGKMHDLLGDWEDFKTTHLRLVAQPDLEDMPYFTGQANQAARSAFDASRRYLASLLYPDSPEKDVKTQQEPGTSQGNQNQPPVTDMQELFAGLMNHTQQVISGSRSVSGIRMPSIEIPKFTGDVRSFRTFDETFNMVASRSHDSKVEKLALLRGKLGEEPLKLVGHLAITEANYDVTWDMLRERYFNMRKLKEAEIDILLDLPDITPRNLGSLRTGIDRVREVRYNLTAVDVDTDNWGPLMSRIIQRKFSKDLLGDFEEALENSNEMPTMDVIEKFLTFQ